MKSYTHDQINWINPTDEQVVFLRSLSRSDHSALIKQASEAGLVSGLSNKSHRDIFEAALLNSYAKA